MKTIKQDDTADQFGQYFESKFEQEVGLTIKEFMELAERNSIDNGYYVEYIYMNWKLYISADNPYWTLEVN